MLGVWGQILKPFKLFFFYFGFDVFFGNKNQDAWVTKEVFNFKRKGFFVDLAATDGVHENNTFFLEKRLGWKGICIEPNKNFYKKLIKNRSAKCLCQIISNKKSNVEYLANGGIGGIIGDEFDNNEKKRKKLIQKAKKNGNIEKRETSSFVDVLKKTKMPKRIDYLSLDVEGAEYEILKKFPFNKYKFMSMTIERPPKKLNNLLFKNGYLFVKNHKVVGFYIHKSLKNQERIKFEKFFQIGEKKW